MATLWDRARLEQLTRRGEPSNHPTRVQRLTDTLHECRSVGESAEQAIREAIDHLANGFAGDKGNIGGALSILKSWTRTNEPIIGRGTVRRNRGDSIGAPTPVTPPRDLCVSCRGVLPVGVSGLFCSSACRTAFVVVQDESLSEPNGAIVGCLCGSCQDLRNSR